jgi:hypothetical protein
MAQCHNSFGIFDYDLTTLQNGAEERVELSRYGVEAWELILDFSNLSRLEW